MEGSSAFQFGRAAYRAGLLGRRAAARRRLGQPPLPPAGRHRRGHRRAARARLGVAAGVRVRDLERLGPDVLAGVLPRIYPQMLARRPRAPGRRAARVHRHRGLSGARPAAGHRARASTARSARSSPRRSTACYTGRPRARSSTARPRRTRSRSSPARGHRPDGVLRLLGLGVRPADAPRGRQPDRGQPRQPRWPRSRARRAGRCCASSGWAGG